MSDFAEVDANNVVLRVLSSDNSMPNEGLDWLIETFGGTWVKTSPNAKVDGFRKNYAGIGYSYDAIRDAFLPPKPFNSWLLDEITCTWYPPTPLPNDGNFYQWDETTLTWILT